MEESAIMTALDTEPQPQYDKVNGGIHRKKEGPDAMPRNVPAEAPITVSNVRFALVLGAAVVTIALVIGGLMWQSNNTKGDHDIVVRLQEQVNFEAHLEDMKKQLGNIKAQLDDIQKEQARQGNIQAFEAGTAEKKRSR